jgi:hypothetical protein
MEVGMSPDEATNYLREYLGLDVVATEKPIFNEKIHKICHEFPIRGIVLICGTDHLGKLTTLCYELLLNGSIQGSIERFESWEIVDFDKSCSLLIITNLDGNLVKPIEFIKGISRGLKLGIPIVITTPLKSEDLDKSLSQTLVSNIVPYLQGSL